MSAQTFGILLVEDDEFVRELVLSQLTELGHRVVALPDADAALRAVDAGEAFDLLITDVMLPGGVDGFALAQRMRALRPGLPVLYASGNAGRQPADAAGAAPVRYLQKPFRLQQLARAVEELMGVGRAS